MLLHFFVALVEIKHFDVGFGVDFVDGIPQSPSSLIVEIVALDKQAVLAHTANPHFTLILLFKNDSWRGEKEREKEREKSEIITVQISLQKNCMHNPLSLALTSLTVLHIIAGNREKERERERERDAN